MAARFLTATGPADAPLSEWLRTAREKRRQMLNLLDAVHAQPLPEPTGDYDSLVEYDRRRVLKEQVLYAMIAACLDLTLAVGALHGLTQSWAPALILLLVLVAPQLIFGLAAGGDRRLSAP